MAEEEEEEEVGVEDVAEVVASSYHGARSTPPATPSRPSRLSPSTESSRGRAQETGSSRKLMEPPFRAGVCNYSMQQDAEKRERVLHCFAMRYENCKGSMKNETRMLMTEKVLADG